MQIAARCEALEQAMRLLKTGGGDPRTGTAHGIHWHMNIGAVVHYVARDGERQDIPWVEVTDKATGEIRVYESQSSPLTMKEDITRTEDVQNAIEATQRKLGRIPGASDLKVERWTFSGAPDEQSGGAFEGGRTLKVNDSLWGRWSSAGRIHVIAHELMHYADSLRPGFWASYNDWQSRGGYLNNPLEIFAEHRAAAVSGLDPNSRYGDLVNAFGF